MDSALKVHCYINIPSSRILYLIEIRTFSSIISVPKLCGNLSVSCCVVPQKITELWEGQFRDCIAKGSLYGQFAEIIKPYVVFARIFNT
jgi:hypothetical protein